MMERMLRCVVLPALCVSLASANAIAAEPNELFTVRHDATKRGGTDETGSAWHAKRVLEYLADNPDEFLQQHRDPKMVELTGAKPSAGQRDLAVDPRYANKLAEMEALLLAEMRRLDDPYRLWNQPDDGLESPKTRSPLKNKQTVRK